MTRVINRFARFFCSMILINAGYISCSLMEKRVSEKDVSFTQIAEARSFLQRLETHLQVITEIVQKNRVLAIQSAHGIYADEDRNQLDLQFQELLKEICRIRESANFKKRTLLNTEHSSWPRNMSLQIDPYSSSILFPLPELKLEKFGILSCSSKDFQSTMDVKTAISANRSIGVMDYSLSILSFERTRIAVLWERLDYSEHLQELLNESFSNVDSSYLLQETQKNSN
ncbi:MULTISPECIES: endoflagellar protein [Leptospira]|nr:MULTISPECIES: endoflagellar protein [Leptospira]ABJ79834.1 Endoflagellar protein [Leptospira borgpetersenii serovar Hardjo-bovis str. L550]AMX59232.1 endoflagellar protein [Leptospira borgpetersenii serovar Hardjo]AMX62461.1 endoflagellar protein [Leptospira borgpetersenii serovar Hardjo]AMX65703.1 endoflagellar protein [Leptospira borgpetersenii serovar Hardjo]AMX68936.1 endoflagellar protein [Leptospira borgpetersenii serovar Hardjo]